MDEVYPEFNKTESAVVGGVDADHLVVMTEALRALVETSEQL